MDRVRIKVEYIYIHRGVQKVRVLGLESWKKIHACILLVNCDPHFTLSFMIIESSASFDAERWYNKRFAS